MLWQPILPRVELILKVCHTLSMMKFQKNLTSLFHRVGRSGRNGLQGTAITLYSPSDDSSIREIEKMGVTFQPKAIKDGEIVDSYDRDRREKRTKKQDEISTKTIGALKKGKNTLNQVTNVQLNGKLKKITRKKRRAERNKNARKTRDSRKQSF